VLQRILSVAKNRGSAAVATGTDGEQKLENKVENGQTVPDAAGDK